MPKTWIIPKNKSILQEKQEKMNKNKWGEGPDCEVVANILYTLALINSDKYHSIIENGLLYIKHQFNTNGFWQSKWYYGNYYGTYVCCRFLKEMGISTEFSKVYSYLAQHQNQDGGWMKKKVRFYQHLLL
jgi:squalene cyclase